MQGDYMAAQDEIKRMTKAIMKLPYHVFAIYHTRVKESKNGAMLAAGPGSVGSATIRDNAKPWDMVLRFESKMVADEKTRVSEQKTLIHSANSGVYIGKSRIHGKNPLPLAIIGSETPFSKYWEKYHELYYPEVKL
jgi:hypothetical protein